MLNSKLVFLYGLCALLSCYLLAAAGGLPFGLILGKIQCIGVPDVIMLNSLRLVDAEKEHFSFK